MGLELLDLLNGTFSLIFVIISTIVGLITTLKYLKTHNRVLIWIGFTWILISHPWWPSALSTFIALATGQGLSLGFYLLIGNFFVPFFVFLLVGAFTEIYFHEKQLIILLIVGIIGVLIDIYIVFYIIVDPTVLGELQGIVDIEFKGFLRIYLILVIILTLTIGLCIGINSYKSENPEIRWRGRFLILAFISWAVGAICDASITLNFITLPLIRILLISSAIEFYLGFVMPDWIKNRLIKE